MLLLGHLAALQGAHKSLIRWLRRRINVAPCWYHYPLPVRSHLQFSNGRYCSFRAPTTFHSRLSNTLIEPPLLWQSAWPASENVTVRSARVAAALSPPSPCTSLFRHARPPNLHPTPEHPDRLPSSGGDRGYGPLWQACWSSASS